MWFVTTDNQLFFERDNVIKKFGSYNQINNLFSDGRFVYILGSRSLLLKIDSKFNRLYDLSYLLKKPPYILFNPMKMVKY